MCSEHAYEGMPKATDTMEDILVPKMFFCAAGAALTEILPPMPPTQLAAARAAVLSGMILPSIEAMLSPVYGADAGASSFSVLVFFPILAELQPLYRVEPAKSRTLLCSDHHSIAYRQRNSEFLLRQIFSV